MTQNQAVYSCQSLLKSLCNKIHLSSFSSQDDGLVPPVAEGGTTSHSKLSHRLLSSTVAQVMVTNVTSLLKTVKAVEDEATRGTRALEATIECIKQELTVVNCDILCVCV